MRRNLRRSLHLSSNTWSARRRSPWRWSGRRSWRDRPAWSALGAQSLNKNLPCSPLGRAGAVYRTIAGGLSAVAAGALRVRFGQRRASDDPKAVRDQPLAETLQIGEQWAKTIHTELFVDICPFADRGEPLCLAEPVRPTRSALRCTHGADLCAPSGWRGNHRWVTAWLLRELKMNVVNVAVTLGSRVDRQVERWQELKNCCDYIGSGWLPPPRGDWRGLTRPRGTETRSGGPRRSRRSPSFWRSTGLYHFLPARRWLEQDAYWRPSPDRWGIGLLGFACQVVETEFWGAMDSPNLMVESSASDVADLVAALRCMWARSREMPTICVCRPGWSTTCAAGPNWSAVRAERRRASLSRLSIGYAAGRTVAFAISSRWPGAFQPGWPEQVFLTTTPNWFLWKWSFDGRADEAAELTSGWSRRGCARNQTWCWGWLPVARWNASMTSWSPNTEAKVWTSHSAAFNLDEYIGVPAEDEHSYRFYMNHHLFGRVNMSLPIRTFRMAWRAICVRRRNITSNSSARQEGLMCSSWELARLVISGLTNHCRRLCLAHVTRRSRP